MVKRERGRTPLETNIKKCLDMSIFPVKNPATGINQQQFGLISSIPNPQRTKTIFFVFTPYCDDTTNPASTGHSYVSFDAGLIVSPQRSVHLFNDALSRRRCLPSTLTALGLCAAFMTAFGHLWVWGIITPSAFVQKVFTLAALGLCEIFTTAFSRCGSGGLSFSSSPKRVSISEALGCRSLVKCWARYASLSE